jgi:hypothetical protein
MKDIVKIEVSSSEAPQLIVLYEAQRKELLKSRDLLNNEIDRIGRIIYALKGVQDESINLEEYIQSKQKPEEWDSFYNSKFLVWKKCWYVLNQRKKFITAREILNEIIWLEPELAKDSEAAKKNYPTIASVLASNSKIGKHFRRIKIEGIEEYYYGLLDWFDDGGNPLVNYL